MKSQICEMLGIEYPFSRVQWLGLPMHPAASIGSFMFGILQRNSPTKLIRKRFERLRNNQKSTRNIMLLSPYADDMARMV